VYRADGTWTKATIEAYDDLGDTYDVVLADGRIKYMCESDCLRHIKVGGFNKHQAVKMLERQAWVWALVDEYFEEDGYTYSYSVALMDGQKRYFLQEGDLRLVQRRLLAGG